MPDVHDFVAHAEKLLTHQWLGEEVGDVVSCRHERNTNLTFLDTFPDEEMTTLDVLYPRVMLWVISQVDG